MVAHVRWLPPMKKKVPDSGIKDHSLQGGEWDSVGGSTSLGRARWKNRMGKFDESAYWENGRKLTRREGFMFPG